MKNKYYVPELQVCAIPVKDLITSSSINFDDVDNWADDIFS